MTCQNCHTPKGPSAARRSTRKDLSGGLEFDEPPFKVTAPNITQDKATGIGAWTDAQIRTALRTGKRPNDVQLAEVMPTGYYGIVTERDMDAIVAYLRNREAGEQQGAGPDLQDRAAASPVPGRARSRSPKPTWPTR